MHKDPKSIANFSSSKTWNGVLGPDSPADLSKVPKFAEVIYAHFV